MEGVIGDAYLRYAEDTTPLRYAEDTTPKKQQAQNMPSVFPKVPPRNYLIHELFPEEHHSEYLTVIHESHDINATRV